MKIFLIIYGMVCVLFLFFFLLLIMEAYHLCKKENVVFKNHHSKISCFMAILKVVVFSMIPIANILCVIAIIMNFDRYANKIMESLKENNQ